ncbi:MAG: 50S ribosomal protein L32e [Methanosarcinales archaeon]|uniref:Large ribosomal subunit protein eL32 n=1 Tax=Candidatus Ethanoperedens thermophilum TaxID=2766897 RepID=A0A848DB76_9EURY|nr:50S ribosomal protein L32e [Candidatus Ethanoperedens thermophilum]
METKHLLKVRKRQKARKPTFKRADSHKKKRLDDNWRKPRGLHSKTRIHIKGRCPVAHPGYGSPLRVKGIHPSGYKETLVHTLLDIENIDAATTAIRIGHTVGQKKRSLIETHADELGIKILNRRQTEVTE